jgi:hypothetical protein
MRAPIKITTACVVCSFLSIVIGMTVFVGRAFSSMDVLVTEHHLPESSLRVLGLDKIPHNRAVTRGCETCGMDSDASIHIANPSITRKVALGDLSCNHAWSGDHQSMLLTCLCPISGLLGHLLHLAPTHEIHVHMHQHLERWWPIYDSAFRRAKVSYTRLRNASLIAVPGNESSYSDIYRVLPVSKESGSTCKNCLRDLAYQHKKLRFEAPCRHVLFISRAGTRRIVDEKWLVNKLTDVAAEFELQLEVYSGNENIGDTTALFAGMHQPVKHDRH